MRNQMIQIMFCIFFTLLGSNTFCDDIYSTITSDGRVLISRDERDIINDPGSKLIMQSLCYDEYDNCTAFRIDPKTAIVLHRGQTHDPDFRKFTSRKSLRKKKNLLKLAFAIKFITTFLIQEYHNKEMHVVHMQALNLDLESLVTDCFKELYPDIKLSKDDINIYENIFSAYISRILYLY